MIFPVNLIKIAAIYALAVIQVISIVLFLRVTFLTVWSPVEPTEMIGMNQTISWKQDFSKMQATPQLTACVCMTACSSNWTTLIQCRLKVSSPIERVSGARLSSIGRGGSSNGRASIGQRARHAADRVIITTKPTKGLLFDCDSPISNCQMLFAAWLKRNLNAIHHSREVVCPSVNRKKLIKFQVRFPNLQRKVVQSRKRKQGRASNFARAPTLSNLFWNIPNALVTLATWKKCCRRSSHAVEKPRDSIG